MLLNAKNNIMKKQTWVETFLKTKITSIWKSEITQNWNLISKMEFLKWLGFKSFSDTKIQTLKKKKINAEIQTW